MKQNLVTAAGEVLEILCNSRVNVGEPGSGEYVLANGILKFAGFWPKDTAGQGDYYQTNLSRTELCVGTRDCGDAPRTTTTVCRCTARRDLHGVRIAIANCEALVAAGDYQVLPIPYVRLSHRTTSFTWVASPRVSTCATFHPTIIPAFTYRVSPPVPAADCETLGVQLLLVARADLPDDAAQRLLKALTRDHLPA